MQKDVLFDTKILKTYTATFFKTFDVSLFNVKKTLDKKKINNVLYKINNFFRNIFELKAYELFKKLVNCLN